MSLVLREFSSLRPNATQPELVQVNASVQALSFYADALSANISMISGTLNASIAAATAVADNVTYLGVVSANLNATLDALNEPLTYLTGNISILMDPNTGLPAAAGPCMPLPCCYSDLMVCVSLSLSRCR